MGTATRRSKSAVSGSSAVRRKPSSGYRKLRRHLIWPTCGKNTKGATNRSQFRNRQGQLAWRIPGRPPDSPQGQPGTWPEIVRTREPCSTFLMDGLDGFIGTFSGLRFWPLDPNPEKILVEDIAHALAHQCRFGGHASRFYSVAEHSVHVSRLCPPDDAFWGLLHDASEAYLVDLPRPLKLLPEFAPYREAERRLQRAVAVRFGLPPDQPARVTEADDTMLWIEAHSLLGSMPEAAIRDTRPPFETTAPLLPVEAERLFLNRFKELTA